MKAATRSLVLGLCAVLGSGCATKALWEEGQFARFREPAMPAELELFRSDDAGKVLVVYDEEADDGSERRRRAFWADLNVQPPDNPRRPRFVGTELMNGLERVPVVEEAAAKDFSAVMSGARGFTLFKDGQEVWSYRLPVYEDGSARMKQIVLTPLTIVADITVMGGILAFWSLSGGGWSGTL
jgi:hypothetical protein